MPYAQKPPATKRELLNRLLSADFNGDLRTLGKGARVSRVGPSVLEVRFDSIGRTFLLSAHIPREEGSKNDGDDGLEFAVPLPQPRQKGSRH